MTLHIDFETRSEVDLTKTGHSRYARHPSTEVHCMAFAGLSGPPSLCIPHIDLICPISAEIAAGELIYGYHVGFERAIWRHIMMPQFGWPDIPDDQWRCSAAKGATHALPRALKHIAVAISAIGADSPKSLGLVMKELMPKLKGRADGKLAKNLAMEMLAKQN